jgi:tRNA A37 methylthiotransferase MiaB
MDFTFGIITTGKDEYIQKIVDSIHSQKIPHYEIIVVGKCNIKDPYLYNVPFDEKCRKAWITKKKNIICKMAKYENICNYIHLPVQSGNTEVLARMNRAYTREWYLDRIAAIRNILPDCAISTDIITGFCDETEEEHQDTLSLMDLVQYDYAYMFKYSERPKTLAERRFQDNVLPEVKGRRLEEIIAKQQAQGLISNQNQLGKIEKVLIEGPSKRSEDHLCGRTSRNAMVIFPKENEEDFEKIIKQKELDGEIEYFMAEHIEEVNQRRQ